MLKLGTTVVGKNTNRETTHLGGVKKDTRNQAQGNTSTLFYLNCTAIIRQYCRS